MPYKLSKSDGGYKVKNKNSGKTYSKKPMSKAKAADQMAAIYANTNESAPIAKLISQRINDNNLFTVLEAPSKQLVAPLPARPTPKALNELTTKALRYSVFESLGPLGDPKVVGKTVRWDILPRTKVR